MLVYLNKFASQLESQFNIYSAIGPAMGLGRMPDHYVTGRDLIAMQMFLVKLETNGDLRGPYRRIQELCLKYLQDTLEREREREAVKRKQEREDLRKEPEREGSETSKPRAHERENPRAHHAGKEDERITEVERMKKGRVDNRSIIDVSLAASPKIEKTPNVSVDRMQSGRSSVVGEAVENVREGCMKRSPKKTTAVSIARAVDSSRTPQDKISRITSTKSSRRQSTSKEPASEKKDEANSGTPKARLSVVGISREKLMGSPLKVGSVKQSPMKQSPTKQFPTKASSPSIKESSSPRSTPSKSSEICDGKIRVSQASCDEKKSEITRGLEEQTPDKTAPGGPSSISGQSSDVGPHLIRKDECDDQDKVNLKKEEKEKTELQLPPKNACESLELQENGLDKTELKTEEKDKETKEKEVQEIKEIQTGEKEATDAAKPSEKGAEMTNDKSLEPNEKTEADEKDPAKTSSSYKTALERFQNGLKQGSPTITNEGSNKDDDPPNKVNLNALRCLNAGQVADAIFGTVRMSFFCQAPNRHNRRESREYIQDGEKVASICEEFVAILNKMKKGTIRSELTTTQVCNLFWALGIYLF